MSARTQGILLIVSLAACTRQREPQCGGTRDYDDEMCDSQGLADRGGCLPPREGHGQQKIVHQPSSAPGEPAALAPPLLLERALTLGGAPVEHAFPTEQEVGVAIPFYFEPPQTFVFKNAQLCSKAFGEAKWSCDVMRALGAGLAAVVPCERTMWTGNLRYFVRLRDASGETIESLGSAKEPFVVAVRQTRQGGPPGPPHMPPPERCVWQDDPPR